jgi:hypothetical protein
VTSLFAADFEEPGQSAAEMGRERALHKTAMRKKTHLGVKDRDQTDEKDRMEAGRVERRRDGAG